MKRGTAYRIHEAGGALVVQIESPRSLYKLFFTCGVFGFNAVILILIGAGFFVTEPGSASVADQDPPGIVENAEEVSPSTVVVAIGVALTVMALGVSWQLLRQLRSGEEIVLEPAVLRIRRRVAGIHWERRYRVEKVHDLRRVGKTPTDAAILGGLPGRIYFRYGAFRRFRLFGDGLGFDAAGEIVQRMKQHVGTL